MRLRSSSRLNASRGFTLVELMVVVAILAVLTITAITSYRYYARRAYAQEARQLLLEMKMKQEQYFSEYGQYVTTSPTVDTSSYYPTVHSLMAGGTNDERWDWAKMNCVSPSGTQETGMCNLGFRPNGATYWQVVTRGWGPADAPSSLSTGFDIIDTMDLTKRWYYAVARRDADGNGVFATLIVTSQTNEIIAIDEVE